MKMRMLLSAVAVCLLFAAAIRAQGEKGGDDVSSSRERGRVRAPELEGGRGWLNTEKPLSVAGLRGKVVLLDFWTYGCVNCMHVIPDLKRLEEKYPTELVVIGVHSAKFENEKETENIRRIVLRYGLEHPVVNDADFRIWNSYAVRAWPTQVLIDTAGYVVGQVAGEGHYDVLDGAIGELVADAKKRGTLDTRPLKFALERAKTGDLPLAFPGKVLADEKGDRLFVADSNHNRVVVTKLDGTFLYTIGSGARGPARRGFRRRELRQPAGARARPFGQLDALRRRHAQSPAAPRRPQRPHGRDRRRHGRAVARLRFARRACADDAAQLALGFGARGAHALRRDGRAAPDLEVGFGRASGLALRGHGARGALGREASGRVSGPRSGDLRAALGAGRRRLDALRRRLRVEHRPRHRERGGADARGRRPLRVRRPRRRGRLGALSTPARPRARRGPALRRRHVQPQAQGARPAQRPRLDLRRHGQAGADGRRAPAVLRARRNLGRAGQALRRRHEQPRRARRRPRDEADEDPRHQRPQAARCARRRLEARRLRSRRRPKAEETKTRRAAASRRPRATPRSSSTWRCPPAITSTPTRRTATRSRSTGRRRAPRHLAHRPARELALRASYGEGQRTAAVRVPPARLHARARPSLRVRAHDSTTAARTTRACAASRRSSGACPSR